ncbi:MAG: acetylornithine transaminase [Firmicutes bacterium]|nr:acetylornithine transaminase [Bacillota bacterium]
MDSQSIMELTNEHVMHTYSRLPLALVKGQGARVWDADGKEYLDFLGGLAVNSLGHCHPRVVEAIKKQAENFLHCSNLYYIQPQAELAKWLVDHSAADRVFFCNSGAEANEAAIKLARRWGKANRGPDAGHIISLRNSFHGRTLATITATGQAKYQEGLEPLPAGFSYVTLNDLAELEAEIERQGDKLCAIMLEVIQGEGGVNVADREYVQAVRRLCDERGVLLIIDEVQTGMGRTGRLFGYEHYDIEPDIFTLAKALGGGVPIGAMLAKEQVAEAFSPGTHASTFGGNPLACAAGLAVVQTMEDEGLVERCAKMGEYFMEGLRSLGEKHPSLVQDVRGKGLILGLEISRGARDVAGACLAKGILVNAIGDRVLRFLPPFIITEAEIDQVVAALDGILSGMASCN